MPDAMQQSFVRSFIDYLKKQLDVLSPDQSESVEVAIQCLQATFDVGDTEPEQKSATQTTTESAAGSAPEGDSIASSSQGSSKVVPNIKNVDLFELFQLYCLGRKPSDFAESIKNEGNRLMKEGKYNEALLRYNQSLQYDPMNPVLFCNRAAAHTRLGDNERAVTDCMSALMYNPNYAKAYCRMGLAYSNLGKFIEAEKAYDKAIALEPDNADYRNNLEAVRRARNQPPQNSNLCDGLNAMMSNPTVRSLFSNAQIDLDQLHSMTQNPMVMNAIGQLFSHINAPGGAATPDLNSTPGQHPPMSNDPFELFRVFAGQLSGGQQPGGTPGDQEPRNQPPPSI